MDTLVEATHRLIHTRFREVEPTKSKLTLDRRDLPWLPKGEERTDVPLTRVRLESGLELFVGSAIRGKTLLEQARLCHGEGPKQFKLFYCAVEEEVNGKHVDRVTNPRTKIPPARGWDIFYNKNGGGVRVYIMEVDRYNNRRVFIRVAACPSKGSELLVYSIIGNETAQERKRKILR